MVVSERFLLPNIRMSQKYDKVNNFKAFMYGWFDLTFLGGFFDFR